MNRLTPVTWQVVMQPLFCQGATMLSGKTSVMPPAALHRLMAVLVPVVRLNSELKGVSPLVLQSTLAGKRSRVPVKQEPTLGKVPKVPKLTTTAKGGLVPQLQHAPVTRRATTPKKGGAEGAGKGAGRVRGAGGLRGQDKKVKKPPGTPKPSAHRVSNSLNMAPGEVLSATVVSPPGAVTGRSREDSPRSSSCPGCPVSGFASAPLPAAGA